MITLHLQPFSLKPISSHEQASFTPSALAHGMTLPSSGSSCHSSHETAPLSPSSQAQECFLHTPFSRLLCGHETAPSRLAPRPLGESYQSAPFHACLRPWDSTVSRLALRPLVMRLHRLTPLSQTIKDHPHSLLRVFISIFHGYMVWIEKPVTRVTDRHHEACRVMPNSDPEWQFFSIHTIHPW